MKPLIRPVFRALRFPDDLSTNLAARGTHRLDDVGAALALLDLVDLVMEEGRLQHVLELEFQHLALELLRSLVELAAQVLVRLLCVVDLFLVLGFDQRETLGLSAADLRGETRTLLVELAFELDLEIGLLLLELLLLPAERKFLLAEGRELRVFRGELLG